MLSLVRSLVFLTIILIPQCLSAASQDKPDYIHAIGLKAGIYTSPGPLTCGGFAGAWQSEEQDARQFSLWGFDYLKYEWCSYGDGKIVMCFVIPK